MRASLWWNNRTQNSVTSNLVAPGQIPAQQESICNFDMTSSLCGLIALSELWGSCVLSKLTLLDMVRLETELLNREYRSGLLRSYRVLPPIHFPLTSTVIHRELCWKWLFSRGFTSKIIVLDEEYFQFPPLKNLLVKNAHALSEGLKTPGFNHSSLLTFLSTTPPALLDKVRYFSLFSWETPLPPTRELPYVRLPFHQLRSFKWHSLGIDHQCLIAALEDNSMLERLRVYVDIPLPVAFFPALSLRGSTLTSLCLEATDLTDADMHAIRQHCRSLTDRTTPALVRLLRAPVAAFPE
jgi:hypothetical protein